MAICELLRRTRLNSGFKRKLIFGTADFGVCFSVSLAGSGLLDVDATMHSDAARFHDNVVIDEFLAGVPGFYFPRWPPKCEREFFVTRVERAIAKVAEDLCSFLLSGAAVINDLSGGVLCRGPLVAPTERFRDQISHNCT
jgi:hypothetical protein